MIRHSEEVILGIPAQGGVEVEVTWLEWRAQVDEGDGQTKFAL